jgi:hypothetical protein
MRPRTVCVRDYQHPTRVTGRQIEGAAAAFGLRPAPSLAYGSRRAPKLGANRGEDGDGGGKTQPASYVASSSKESERWSVRRMRILCDLC